MAMTPTSAVRTTSGDTWTDLISGPAIVTQAICANNGVGDAKVSLRFMKGSATANLVPGDILAFGASSRFRIGALSLASGDKLQAKSFGTVDWTISGTTV